jgi:hypothetical protein
MVSTLGEPAECRRGRPCHGQTVTGTDCPACCSVPRPGQPQREAPQGFPLTAKNRADALGLPAPAAAGGCQCADPPPCRTAGPWVGRPSGSRHKPRTASRLKLEMGPPAGAALRGSGVPSCACWRRWWSGQVPGWRAMLDSFLAETSCAALRGRPNRTRDAAFPRYSGASLRGWQAA